ncbi:MAG: hypothetical protein GXO89_11895, partial [Chlorobi bacterium]|nr:hypothetical protein [Chlorobiota bacterium]
MKINKENYGAYFLDYYEKNLDTEQVAELLVFLEENPVLKEEFEDFDIEIILDFDNGLHFEKKESLKKTTLIAFGGIDETNYEETMLDELEGGLSEKGAAGLKGFLSANPKIKLEYNLLKSTFLVPDKTIVFENKEELKKEGVFAIYSTQIYYALSIAATIFILLGFFFGISRKGQNNRDFTKLNKIEILHPSFSEKKIVEARKSPENNTHITVSEKPDIQQQGKKPVYQINGHKTSREKEELIETIPSVIGFEITIPESDDEILIVSRSSFDGVSSIIIENSATEKEKSFMAKFISGLGNKIIPKRKTERKSILEYTVEGFNLMADKEVEVIREKDENGNVIAFNVVGDNMQFTRRKRNVGK